jgi:hypothetical protein
LAYAADRTQATFLTLCQAWVVMEDQSE